MTWKSDSISVTCTRLRHFADTFSQLNSSWKKITLGHMTENNCSYQMHIFFYLILKATRTCVAVLLHGAATLSAISHQMHHQNPADAPPESCGTTRIRHTPTESCLHLQRAYVIFSFKITKIVNMSCNLHTIRPSATIFLFHGTGMINYYWVLLLYALYFIL